MIKTLRITSVLAVMLAVAVLATVLGYLRPAKFIHLNLGVKGDKQVEQILGSPSAVDRFKTQFGSKVPNSEDTTPPLIKQAELLAGIINPPPSKDAPPASTPPLSKITPVIKPQGLVSSKFDLLGTSYSSNPATSFAYIRLPDSTFQWVGPGTEIGHVTIKEIRNGSVVCWDGKKDFEVPAEATPETSSLLETGNLPPTPAPSAPRPAVGGKAQNSPVKPSAVAKAAVPATSAPPTQISKEEQENLSRLGDKIKNGAGANMAEREAAVSKMISEYKSTQANPAQAQKLENPGGPADVNRNASSDSPNNAINRWKNRLNTSRSMKK